MWISPQQACQRLTVFHKIFLNGWNPSDCVCSLKLWSLSNDLCRRWLASCTRWGYMWAWSQNVPTVATIVWGPKSERASPKKRSQRSKFGSFLSSADGGPISISKTGFVDYAMLVGLWIWEVVVVDMWWGGIFGDRWLASYRVITLIIPPVPTLGWPRG